jgi:magnesium transporter
MVEYLNLSKKVGMAPGALIHVGDILEEKPQISLINYDNDTIEEKQITTIDELLKYKNKKSVTWFNIEGLQNIESIEAIGKIF